MRATRNFKISSNLVTTFGRENALYMYEGIYSDRSNYLQVHSETHKIMIMRQANVTSKSRTLRVSVSFVKYAAVLLALLLFAPSSRAQAPADPSNPYDQTGVWQNAMLDYYIQVVGGSTIAATAPDSEIWKIMNHWYEDSVSICGWLSDWAPYYSGYCAMLIPSYGGQLGGSASTLISIYYDVSVITCPQASYLYRISALTDSLSASEVDTGAYLSSLSGIESDILIHMPDTMMVLPLSVLSAARASVYYWSTQFGDPPPAYTLGQLTVAAIQGAIVGGVFCSWAPGLGVGLFDYTYDCSALLPDAEVAISASIIAAEASASYARNFLPGSWVGSGTIATLGAPITDWRNSLFANPINPYDYIGLQHNNLLVYVNNNMAESVNTDTLYPNSDTFAVHYADSVQGYSTDSLSAHLKFVRFVITHIDSILNNSGLSDPAMSYISEIYSIVGDTTSLNTQIFNILLIEDSASVSLSGVDKQVVLTTAAIARYSDAYWRSSDTLNWPNLDSARYHQRATVEYPTTLKKQRQTPSGWLDIITSVTIFVVNHKWAQADLIFGAGGAVCGLPFPPLGSVFGALGAGGSASVWSAMGN